MRWSVLNVVAFSPAAAGWGWLRLAGILSVSSAALSACTPLRPGDDTPVGDAFGVAAADAGVFSLGGPPPAPGWSCLQSLARQDTTVRPADDNGRRWVYSARAVSFLTGQVIPGLSVRACREADVNCQQPLTEALPADPDGWVDVPISEGFAGYFEFTAPSIVPVILIYNRLLQNSGSLNYPLGLLELEAVSSLSAAGGTPQNPNLGLLIVSVYDCSGLPADGIQLLHDRGGTPWYLVDGLPSFGARSTSPQGIGGFVNVSPGISVIRSTLVDGTPLAPPQSVFVRSGWITSAVSDVSGGP